LAKKKSPEVKKVITKRQLSRIKVQERRQQIIKIIGSIVIVAVLVILGFGVNRWYVDDYKPLKQTVVEVNGASFDMQYFIDMLAFISGDYSQYASYFTSYALQYTEYYELIKQAAEEIGVTVSDKEVKEEIQSQGYEDNRAVRDVVRGNLILNKLKSEYFDATIPTSAEHSYVLAMFLESEAQVQEVKDRIAGGESFEDIAEELSLNDTTQEDKGVIGWIPAGVIDDILGTSVLDDSIFGVEPGVLNDVADEDTAKDVGYWILKVESIDVPEATTTTVTTTTGTVTTTQTTTVTDPETAVVKAMLLGSEQEAQEVLDRLNAGEDFDTLAEEYSQIWDDTDGSTLEVTEGDYSEAFDDFVFNPDVETGVLSRIIRDTDESTTGGYWLFEVTERSTMDISDENRNTLLNNALGDWVNALDYDNVVESLTDDMRAFAAAQVSGS
jgi:parvulin-like peptidyl-prolyl isomerase